MQEQIHKLYFAPGACSFATHIALKEAGIPFTLEKVDLREKKTADGADYLAINPLGYVPVLIDSRGAVMTEASATLLYIADIATEVSLSPAEKTPERYQLYRWMAFLATELHKSFGPLFKQTTPESVKQETLDRLHTRFVYIEQHLSTHEWIVGNAFSVADIYAFVLLGWTGYMKIDMSKYPHITAFLARIGERESVREAGSAEHA